MSASYTRSDRVLSAREREKFRREIDERRRALTGQVVVPHVNGAGPEGMSERRAGRWNGFLNKEIHEDHGMLNAQMRHMQRVLDKGSPRNLTRREKQMLEKEITEDREYFKKNMVSAKTYYQPSTFANGDSRRANPDFDKAQRAVFTQEVSNVEFQRRANRYKNNVRELDPDNPDASNIERFRPKK